jgi:hypothetical protein
MATDSAAAVYEKMHGNAMVDLCALQLPAFLVQAIGLLQPGVDLRTFAALFALNLAGLNSVILGLFFGGNTNLAPYQEL